MKKLAAIILSLIISMSFMAASGNLASATNGNGDTCQQTTTFEVDEDNDSDFSFDDSDDRVRVDFDEDDFGNDPDNSGTTLWEEVTVTADSGYDLVTVEYDVEKEDGTQGSTSYVTASHNGDSVTINPSGTGLRVDKVRVTVIKDCVAPTPTVTPTPTSTPVTPTATPTPTCTPTPTVTPTPTTGQPVSAPITPTDTPTPTDQPSNNSSQGGDGLSDGRSDGLSSCPSCTQAPQGQVAGVQAVLGASTMAKTGTFEQNLMNSSFILGMMLLALGATSYAKEKKI